MSDESPQALLRPFWTYGFAWAIASAATLFAVYDGWVSLGVAAVAAWTVLLIDMTVAALRVDPNAA